MSRNYKIKLIYSEKNNAYNWKKQEGLNNESFL